MFDKQLCKWFQKETITVEDIVKDLAVLGLLVGLATIVLLCIYKLIKTMVATPDMLYDMMILITLIVIGLGVCELIDRIGKYEVAHCPKK
jgi:hypothetical protein